MAANKSLDEITIIEHLLHDVQTSCGSTFGSRALRLTVNKVRARYASEGIGFLTKTLPRLGKAFDKALSGGAPLNSTALGFDSMNGSKLPRFLGELFSRVLNEDGMVLQDPCAKCVQMIRDVLYCFYKYKLPYNDEQKSHVLAKFIKTEQEVQEHSVILQRLAVELAEATGTRRRKTTSTFDVAREARISLNRLFSGFDAHDIVPNHGPGAVATKQKLWGKYEWRNVASRITDEYPFDAYYCASLGHFCDTIGNSFNEITTHESPARVILVPKDSRGPRLISCEPVDFQWIQQGIMKRIVRHVESHPLTANCVFFTNQVPNRIGALFGSSNGRYATLDLNEASDRVSLELVRLLFPSHVLTCLEATRSLSTELPSKDIIKLGKFAPMGSALCFPVLALTVWAILNAAAPDAYTRERIHVYGDDVIVPTAFAANAIEQLEAFGLKVNRDKSCISGLFRESCGMDAFNGVCVTPVRIRTVWSSSPSPDTYVSWISYANSFYDKGYYSVYNYIVEHLRRIYGPIPGEDMHLACPSLRVSPDNNSSFKARTNKALQKREYKVWDLKVKKITHEMDGWSMLLRYFTEGQRASEVTFVKTSSEGLNRDLYYEDEPFSVRTYTKRRSSMLVRRWR